MSLLRRRRRHALPLATIAVVLVATGLRTIGLAGPSVWFDEAWTAHAAQQATLTGAWLADGTNPPLGYALAWLAARGIGSGEFALRLPAALLGVVEVALAARVAGRAFGRRAAPLAALLVAASPLQVWAGREARMYTLLTVCALGALTAWLALAVHRPSAVHPATRRVWALLVLAEVGALYSHNTGPVVVLALNAMTAAAWLFARRLDAPAWRSWLASQAIVAAAWAPEWAGRFRGLAAANGAFTARPRLDGATLGSLWTMQWAVPWGRPVSPFEQWLLGAALAAVLLAVPWRRRIGRALAGYVGLLVIGVVAGLIVLQNELHARYVVMAGPPLWIAVAGGLAGRRSTRRGGSVLRDPAAEIAPPYPSGPGPLRTALRNGAVGAVLAIAFVVGLTVAFRHDHWHEDARAMARHEARTLGPADTIVTMTYADRYDLAYYAKREGVTARRIALPEAADMDEAWRRLPRTGRVALSTRYGSPADHRGMLPCLLGARAIGAPAPYTAAGLSEQHYMLDGTLDRDPARASWSPGDALRPIDAVAFVDEDGAAAGDAAADDAAAPAGRVVAVGAPSRWPADRAICVVVRFIVDDPRPAGDLKAAVIARDAFGAEIAHADAVLSTPDERGAGDVPAGTALDGFALLRLPVGAPPGDVPLWLRVYDPVAAPNGLSPRPVDPGGSTVVVGTNVLVGHVAATVGTWGGGAGGAGGVGGVGGVGRVGDASGVGGPVDAANGETASGLPRRLDIASAGPRLVATDAPTTTVDAPPLLNGATARVALLWRGGGELPSLALADVDGRWTVAVPPPLDWDAPVRRDVRLLRVPRDAQSGVAELRLPDGAVVGRWRVNSAPLTTTAPPLVARSDATFPGIGTLLGIVRVEGGAPGRAGDPLATILARATPGPPLTVTLAWRASGDGGGDGAGGGDGDGGAGDAATLGRAPFEAVSDLTVFVQILDAANRVVAQSDAPPAGGTRPTTGWRAGEVIIDAHRLEWWDGPVAPPLRWIAGLYDATSGVRARTVGGEDAVELGRGDGGAGP